MEMEKLVYSHFWGDEGCSGTSYIAFEYESKEKFVFDILEKYKDQIWEHEWTKVLVFFENDVYLDKYEIEGIEHNVQTLDQWFEREKIFVIL